MAEKQYVNIDSQTDPIGEISQFRKKCGDTK